MFVNCCRLRNRRNSKMSEFTTTLHQAIVFNAMYHITTRDVLMESAWPLLRAYRDLARSPISSVGGSRCVNLECNVSNPTAFKITSLNYVKTYTERSETNFFDITNTCITYILLLLLLDESFLDLSSTCKG